MGRETTGGRQPSEDRRRLQVSAQVPCISTFYRGHLYRQGGLGSRRRFCAQTKHPICARAFGQGGGGPVQGPAGLTISAIFCHLHRESLRCPRSEVQGPRFEVRGVRQHCCFFYRARRSAVFVYHAGTSGFDDFRAERTAQKRPPE